MNQSEILQIISNGENSGVEFKEDTLENRVLAKALVALTNLRGGQVLLGVRDDGTVAGLTRPNLELWVMDVCRDKIRPEIIPYYEVVKGVAPGKDVAVVSVDRGWDVHAVWHDGGRRYYIRVGTESREATQEELARLLQRRGGVRLEVRPVPGSSLQDLDLKRLADYFARVREQVPPGLDEDEAWVELLINTEIMTRDDESARASYAGILLFGRNVNRLVPQAGIDAAAYPGTEKDYAANERKALRGPLVPLFGRDGLTENGIVEQAAEFVRRNTPVTAELIDGTRRVDRQGYPDEVIREAVVNAVVHRDYSLSATDIELSIYQDRLEIVSPGRLPNDITPARMLAGCRAARNQLIKDVMRDYGYLEHMGMGVPRKILRGMREHNGTDPILEELEESFRITLLA